MNDIQKQAKIAELQARIEVEVLYAKATELGVGTYHGANTQKHARRICTYADELQKIAEADDGEQ